MNREKTEQNMELHDIVEIEDERTVRGEAPFSHLPPLRSFRGNYGVPRRNGDKVVKAFFTSSQEEIDKVQQIHERYTNEIRNYLPLIPETPIVSHGRFHIEQPFVQAPTFEEFLQSDEDTTQKINAYTDILGQALRLLSLSDKTIGIDAKPENWMLVNGIWTFIDTFPPFYSDNNIHFGDVFNLRQFERDFARRPDRSFFRNIAKVARRFCLKASKFTPFDLEGATYDAAATYAPSAGARLAEVYK